MLTSTAEHLDLVDQRSVDFRQPDAPRVGGFTAFLRITAIAAQHHIKLAPHFAMEIHLHLAAAYEHEPRAEHFEWLEPLFNERLDIRDGRRYVPARPGLGFGFSDQARAWTTETHTAKR